MSQLSEDDGYTRIDTAAKIEFDSENSDLTEMTQVKRKTSICYCVLKLASHGEVFKMI